MYESPITLMFKEMAEQAAKRLDEETFKAVYSVMPTVDKEELIRALRYDRGQYDKGYADGKRDAMEELVRCKDCKYRSGFVGRPPFMFYTCTCAEGLSGAVRDNNFCSYGERREE